MRVTAVPNEGLTRSVVFNFPVISSWEIKDNWVGGKLKHGFPSIQPTPPAFLSALYIEILDNIFFEGLLEDSWRSLELQGDRISQS